MKKILIFEEDIVFSFILKRTLEKLGYSAVVVNNEANVRNAFVTEKTFDLFLFDTGEDVDNVDFLQKVRDENPTLKIIISSGFIIGKWRKFKIQGLLMKPYTIQELDLMLKNIFSEKTDTNILFSH